MNLLLRVRTSPDQTHDVSVVAHPDAPVQMLFERISAFFGVCGPFVLESSGATLDPSTSLRSCGLVSGEVIVVGGSRIEVRTQREHPCFDVLSGPQAGLTIPLQKGHCLLEIGRGAPLEIFVDPNGEVRLLSSSSVTTFVDGSRLLCPVRLRDGAVVRCGDSRLVFRQEFPVLHASSLTSHGGRIPYFRAPRRPSMVQTRALPLLGDIPGRVASRKPPVLSFVAPLIGGLAMYAFSQRLEFLVLTLLMPLVSVASWWEDRRSSAKEHQKEVDRFRSATRRYVNQLKAGLLSERNERLAAAPDVAQLCRSALTRSVSLWTRGRESEDFLTLRLGLGNQAAFVAGGVAEQGDIALRDEARELLAGLDRLDDVPVIVDLMKQRSIAIFDESLLVSFVVQAATLHSPDDLVIATAIDRSSGLSHLFKWLPHARSSLLEQTTVANESDAGLFLSDVLDLARERSRSQLRHDRKWWPHVLVVLDEFLDFEVPVLEEVLELAPSSGISVVWLAVDEARLPRRIGAIVRASDRSKATLWRNVEHSDQVVAIETISRATADEVARALAPLYDAGGRVEGGIPAVVSLFSVLGLSGDADDNAIERRLTEQWNREEKYALKTPLGCSTMSTIELDLVAQGPHVLVGGTSGSGKSELLVSLVAGLLANYSPTRVNLLFVDYKGGAATEIFRNAPHTVGYVTNLDEGMAERALISLRAELNRRMRLFEGRAKDLAEMLHRFPSEAPPSLVIVVDEFAALVKEIPEFMGQLVDIAQRGRSLGVHLVLATQSPSGTIDEKIQANVNARIGLRMVDVAESTAVLGSNEATTIPLAQRGRGFACLGSRQLVEFQSAYGGIPVGRAEVFVDLALFDLSSPVSSTRQSVQGVKTQLETLMDGIVRVSSRLHLSAPFRPWMDPLPVSLMLDDLEQLEEVELKRSAMSLVPIGLADLPEQQEQPVASVDLEQGGVLVVGASGSGKTTFLQTVTDVLSTRSDEQGSLMVVAFDFASGELESLREVEVVADVIRGDNLEAVTRTIAALEIELERRKASSVAMHGKSLIDESQTTTFPRIVVLVDGYHTMREVFQGQSSLASFHLWLDKFHGLLRDGRKLGIHAVLATDRAHPVPAVLSSAVSSQVVLRQNTPEAFAELGIPLSLGRQLDVPGRAVLNRSCLVQLAMTYPEKRVQRSGETVVVSRRLETVERVSTATLTKGRLHALLGVEDVTGEQVFIDLEGGSFVVCGPSASGRSTALSIVASSLASNFVDVYLAGAARSGLRKSSGFARQSFGDADDLFDLLRELIELSQSWDLPRVLVVDDLDKIPESPELVTAWNQLATCERVSVVAALDVRSFQVGYFQSELFQKLKTSKAKLLLQPIDDVEIQTTLGVRTSVRPGLDMPAGRGILRVANRSNVVQVGLSNSASLQEPASELIGGRSR